MPDRNRPAERGDSIATEDPADDRRSGGGDRSPTGAEDTGIADTSDTGVVDTDGSVTDTSSTGSDVGDPDVSDPDVGDPDISDPDVTDPDVTDPDATDGAALPGGDRGGRRRARRSGRSGRRRIDRGLLIASLVIAGGILLIAWGLIGAVTGDEGVDRPDPIEALSPVENAVQALQQERVFVDLEFGYEAELEIDGVVLPTTRLGEIELEPGEQAAIPPTAVFDAGNSVISFQPSDGAPIESFDEGRHEVRVIYWRIEEGRGAARSYAWSFDVL